MTEQDKPRWRKHLPELVIYSMFISATAIIGLSFALGMAIGSLLTALFALYEIGSKKRGEHQPKGPTT